MQTGIYSPKPSVQTIANAMDVGDPSNFVRILALYGHSYDAIKRDISGSTYTDEQISETLRNTFEADHYLLDPHGAVAYRALLEGLKPNETGVFLETAHPAKFKSTVDSIISGEVEIPVKLQKFMEGQKQSIPMSAAFPALKKYLLEQ